MTTPDRAFPLPDASANATRFRAGQHPLHRDAHRRLHREALDPFDIELEESSWLFDSRPVDIETGQQLQAFARVPATDVERESRREIAHDAALADRGQALRVGNGTTPLRLSSAFQVPKASMTHTLAGQVRVGFIEMRADEVAAKLPALEKLRKILHRRRD